MFIRIGIRKTLETLTTFLVQVRNFYYLLDFEVFNTRREKQFLICWLFHLTRQRRRTPLDSTWLVSVQISTNCLFFPKYPRIPAHRFRARRHSHPQFISYPGFLLWHLWLSHPPRTSVNTGTQCVHLTNLNDKIKPTKNDNIKKSFRNYITLLEGWLSYQLWYAIKQRNQMKNLGKKVRLIHKHFRYFPLGLYCRADFSLG